MRNNPLCRMLLFSAAFVGCSNATTAGTRDGISGTGVTLAIQLSPPDAQVAGGNVLVTVEALNADQSIATNFTGTVRLTTSDLQASLPEAYTFTLADGGLKEFDVAAILKTAGAQTLTVEGADGETRASATVTIKSAAATSLQAAGLEQGLSAGLHGSLVVTAHDPFGNIAEGYAGRVAVTSGNPNAHLPAAYTYNANDKGRHAFDVAFDKAGAWTVAARDANTQGLGVGNTNVSVVPGDANRLGFAGLPSLTSAGAAQSANVTVYDAYGNVAVNFTGAVHFNTNDIQATVPPAYTFTEADAGVATFSNGFVLLTAAAQNITVSTRTNIAATARIVVNPLALSALALVPSPNVVAGAAFDATVNAVDRYNNVLPWVGTVHFEGSDLTGSYPLDYLFTGGDHGSHQFRGLLTQLEAGAQNITVVDNAHLLASGTAKVQVTPGALAALSFGPLRWVTANANFVTRVTAIDGHGNLARNFAGAINVFSTNGNFTPQRVVMNPNMGGVATITGRFAQSGTFTLSANNTIDANIVASAGFTVSSALSFGLGQAANVVVGQANFNNSKPATCGGYAAGSLWDPTGGIYVDADGKVWLPDTGNHRIVGYDVLPASNGTGPDFEIGQAGLDTSASWPATPAASPNSFTPGSVSGNGGTGLVVADTAKNRVLIYNVAPTSSADADAVVGQPNFLSASASCSSATLNQPSDALVVGSRLFVSDTDNHRVVIWGSVPNASAGLSASWVLGQANLGTCLPGTDANRLNAPHGLWSNGMLLAVADSNNNRVLVWNDVSNLAADGVAANVVIGQASMTTAASGSAMTAMQAPFGVFGNGTSLFVSDSGNHRVLVYAATPTQSGAAASSALGQAPSGGIGGCASTASSAQTLSTPYGIGLSGKTLIVGSADESRYLLFQSN